MSTYAIEPKTLTVTTVKTITAFQIVSCIVTPFQSAVLQVMLQNEEGLAHEYVNLTLEGAEYTAWGDNDQFLVDKVTEKLGYTLKP